MTIRTPGGETRVARLAAALVLVFAAALSAGAGALEDWQAGYDAENAGEFDLAIHHYTRAIQSGDLTQSGLARVFRSRGNSHYADGAEAEALKDYDTAISLDPGYVMAYVSRGVVYHRQGQYERAIADYDEAIRIDPSYALAYADRGGAFEQLERFEEAVSDFKTAYELGFKADWLVQVLDSYGEKP